ncbi:putative uncharacterized protein DDB_G0277255 isoform X2 [Microplitis demolitor]|uniref:putative uncharacterized protein DDB_G0277255 isoform X2 n=1 Tax=Microplitis demolitor TaxID=69319 RepID=UPI00235B634D|nr:putative uncharacterized protein DDB_G0277255 isoform X2 [Microplitis demolitor]
MQWRRQKKINHVIGSAHHVLLIARYQYAPPGDDDDEDGIRKARDSSTRNTQSTHKSSHPRSSEQKNRTENGVANGDSAGASPSRSSQPKIIFDENEYTRITTPRQDVLFKKGYLARKKVWSGNNASTSATPSTTESQSASHSTADGSETTEDPQLLDYRENGLEEFPNAEPPAQMSYGTFYDHASGYYYEYPVMVVGPPMPGPPMHNLLAAMPCDAVPLRPIEWVNPAFVPKYEQPYCLVDYQNPQVDQQLPPTIHENGVTPTEPETTNGDEPVENGNGSTSWTGSVAGEEPVNGDEQQQSSSAEPQNQQDPQANFDEVIVDSSFPSEPCLETVLAQQLHVSHVGPPVPQPYMYPGHYMFGPALINVNGMTIQSGPMMRTNDMNATTTAFTRRRRKKKLSRRKLRRPLGLDNSEYCGQEEEDYSSEADNNGVQTSSCINNSFVPTSSRPLNPNCKEFEFKPSKIISQTSNVTVVNSVSISKVVSENHSNDLQPSDFKIKNSIDLSSSKPTTPDAHSTPTESPAIVTNIEYATEAIANESSQMNGLANGNGSNETQETEIGVDVTCADFNDIIDKLEDNSTDIPIQNPVDTIVPNGNEDCDRLSNGTVKSVGTNDSRDTPVIQRLPNKEILPKNNVPKKKYKSTKLVREPTPGPECEEQHPSTSELETDLETHVEGVPMGIDAIQAQLNADTSNEDSGFESQTRFSSNRPITDAVTQWLRRANSPELFVTTINNNNNEDSETEDDELEDSEPPKNLQGNPMPALSANSSAYDVTTSSRPASCGEFARTDSPRDGNASSSRKKLRSRGNKKKLPKNKTAVTTNNDNNNNSDGVTLTNRQQRKKSRAAAKLKNKQLNGNCEFTEKDSDAGMRVANNSRITKMDKIESITNGFEESVESSRKIERINIDQVKTYEQGEIVVSIDGKLISTTICGTTIQLENNINNNIDQEGINYQESVNRSAKNSIGSIEEPDMLEYWDSENIEPFNNNNMKPVLQKHDENSQSDEIDNDNNKSCIKVDPVSLDIVRKYYRLARGSVQSISSIEDGICDLKQSDNESKSRLVTPERSTAAHVCGNEIPVISSSNQQYIKLPIDEAIEVYESCYTGKPPGLIFHSNLYKTHSLYGYDRHEGPIPCRTTCCIVQ